MGSGGEIGDGDGDEIGDGDGDGDGDMGGASIGGVGGMEGDPVVEPESREVCGKVGGMGGALMCADVPEACGDMDQYEGEHFFDAAGAQAEIYADSNGGQVFYLFDDNDYVLSQDEGSCFVGGDGDDYFELDSHYSGSDTFIGGAGADEFYFVQSDGKPKIIADFTPGEDKLSFLTFRFSIPTSGEAGDPANYMAVVADFDGTNAQVPSAGTRFIYDPNTGTLWSDKDGNVATLAPTHTATFLNYESIMITASEFYDYSVD